MVDVAEIFDEVFGADERAKGSSENGCVRCVGVSEGAKPLESRENPNTPAADKKHTSNQGVCEAGTRCVRDIVENQEVAGAHTPTHHTHRKSDNPSVPVDPDAFEERSAIIEHDAGLPRQEAETLAAQEQGHAGADSLHSKLVQRWATEIERLGGLPAVSPDGAQALKRAQAFIAEGWALQATRLGWDEVELFGVCPRAPERRLDRKGAAFGGAVQFITQEMVSYVGGQRRYRAQVNNDGGTVLIWELAPNNPQ